MTAGRAAAAVQTDRAEYRIALAELTTAGVPVESASGAIAVIDGSGQWTERAHVAAVSGAIALIIAEPTFVAVALLDDLRAALKGLPVVVSRRSLPADVVQDAVCGRGEAAPPDVLLIDATCTPAAQLNVVRDAIGWLRALGGGRVRLLSAAVDRGGVLAHLESSTPSGGLIPSSLVLSVSTGGWRGSLLRLSGLGAVRTHVLIDSEARIRAVDTLSERGSLRAPERFEEGPRVALRRMFEALAEDGLVDDLTDLAADMRVAEAILQTSATHK